MNTVEESGIMGQISQKEEKNRLYLILKTPHI